MVITELSLVEYYDKIIPRAKRKNYKWVISVIARHADAKELYQHIEEDWASIAFCTLWRSQMRFRAVALRSITAARF